MSTTLLTGGAGFIGSYVTKELLNLGHKVIIYDAFINYIEPNEGFYPVHLKYRLREFSNHENTQNLEIIRGDIRDYNFFLQTLKQFKPETIIHLAAIPLATASNKFTDEAIDINMNGLISIIKAVGAVDFVKRIVYTSSSFVYGHFQYTPADENHPKNPIDVYGGTKLAGENIIKGFGERFGVEYIIIRPSAVYGPTDSNLRVSQILIQNALMGKPLVLHDGGESTLDFSYVEDVANGFVLAAINNQVKNEDFNITRGEGRTLKEFAEIIKNYIPDTKIQIVPGTDEKRPKRGALDISKARKLLDYNPKYNLEEGIKKYLEFIKKNNLISL